MKSWDSIGTSIIVSIVGSCNQCDFYLRAIIPKKKFIFVIEKKTLN
jgi:hypothetical protein